MTQSPDRSSSKKTQIAIALWLAAIAVAALFDRVTAVWVRDSGLETWMYSHPVISEPLKALGLYWVMLTVTAVVTLVHPLRWRAGLFTVVAVAVSGMNSVLKWFVGRTRPFKLDVFDATGRARAEPFMLQPFRWGWWGAAHQINLSFPSGHAALAFATAASLAMLWPRSKWRWAAYIAATLVAMERVSENAHWLSDTVAAAALGVGGVYLVHHWFGPKLLRPAPLAERPVMIRHERDQASPLPDHSLL